MKRATVVVMDACGVGALPDAADYGDEGTNTLGHLAQQAGGLALPALRPLGLRSAIPPRGPPRGAAPRAPGARPPPRPGGRWGAWSCPTHSRPPPTASPPP